MSNQLKNLLSVVTMSFVMIGCSSGSNSSNSDSSTPAVDNSVLADGEKSSWVWLFWDTSYIW